MNYLQRRLLRRYYPEMLAPFERRVYSQNGEDGIIAEIFYRIGVSSRYAVEFGVEDGKECNTRRLKEQGWDVLQMDGDEHPGTSVKREFITAENINKLFAKYKVPKELDFLCIDIDRNDYWVWKALDKKYRPRLIVIEYNSSLPTTKSVSVKYDPKAMWDGSNHFGASLLAYYRLAVSRGYSLVYCEQQGVNAFLVRNDLLGKHLVPRTPSQAFVGAGYGNRDNWGASMGHRQGKGAYIEVTPTD